MIVEQELIVILSEAIVPRRGTGAQSKEPVPAESQDIRGEAFSERIVMRIPGQAIAGVRVQGVLRCAQDDRMKRWQLENAQDDRGKWRRDGRAGVMVRIPGRAVADVKV